MLQLTKDIFDVLEAAVVIGAAIIAIATLRLHKENLKLQIKTLQASLFKDITGRLDTLTDQWQADADNEAKQDWYDKVFMALDKFAFYANQDLLTTKMKEYYKGYIVEVCRDRLKEYPDLLERLKGLPPEQTEELRKFYKELTDKELPF